MVETPFAEPAYNGELRPIRGTGRGQYRGKSNASRRYDPVTTESPDRKAGEEMALGAPHRSKFIDAIIRRPLAHRFGGQGEDIVYAIRNDGERAMSDRRILGL
jgi:hypothetical protein